MGYFNNIKIINYRNFENYTLSFSSGCNVLYGQNGSGKTNILESISLFTKGRGLRKDKLSNMIKKDCKNFKLKADFISKKIVYNLISETLTDNNKVKKILSVNSDKSKETLQTIYDLTPFLSFLPETERLFLASPSSRRGLIDQFIFTYQNKYNQLINKYNKLLQERTKLLVTNNYDQIWISKLEQNIARDALEIYSLRDEQLNILKHNLNFYMSDFNLPFKINVKLSDKFYKSGINQDHYEIELIKNRKIDSILGGCKIGPHKSDYIFYVNEDFLVSQLSTGQQKTIILLIFLAQCKYLTNTKNKKPILLLDEVCSHLDEFNRGVLMALVESFNLQIFMTGTSKNLFSFLSTNTNFCNIVAK